MHTFTIKGKQVPGDTPVRELIDEPVSLFGLLSKQVQDLNNKKFKEMDDKNKP